MGLLVASQGAVLIDDVVLAPNTQRAWQRHIAHVPQSIYLADSTIAENIAFVVPNSAIDVARVHQAARQAQIADYIDTLHEPYQTQVRERGIRVSGGQRPRICIASALSKNTHRS